MQGTTIYVENMWYYPNIFRSPSPCIIYDTFYNKVTYQSVFSAGVWQPPHGFVQVYVLQT